MSDLNNWRVTWNRVFRAICIIGLVTFPSFGVVGFFMGQYDRSDLELLLIEIPAALLIFYLVSYLSSRRHDK